MLGKKLKALTVSIVPKEKKIPEPIKPKVEEKKLDISKPVIQQTTPKLPEQIIQQKIENIAPAVAPPPIQLPSVDFNDGAKEVKTITDPIELYKNYIETSIRSQWRRPENINDENYVALIELTIDNKGKIVDNKWQSGSGDVVWDKSVKDIFVKLKSIPRSPPTGFPKTFKVKFDSVLTQ